jgi:AP-3 complex subunit delta
LFLIYPLFSIYDLNPVAPHAQASVPVPPGLDLDAWIVPPPQEPVTPVEEVKEKKKKSKKGKEEVNGKKSKTSSKKKLKQVELLQDGDVLTPVDPDIETPEERERVSI